MTVRVPSEVLRSGKDTPLASSVEGFSLLRSVSVCHRLESNTPSMTRPPPPSSGPVSSVTTQVTDQVPSSVSSSVCVCLVVVNNSLKPVCE